MDHTPRDQTVVSKFATRRDAETAVEHLVQEHKIERADIFIRAAGAANTSGERAAGADIHSGHPGVKKTAEPELAGPIEVSVDCHGDRWKVVSAALEKAGGTGIRTS